MKTPKESIGGCCPPPPSSTFLFSVVLPDGKRIEGFTRKQATDCLALLPIGARIDPPIPPGNPAALNLLDALCK